MIKLNLQRVYSAIRLRNLTLYQSVEAKLCEAHVKIFVSETPLAKYCTYFIVHFLEVAISINACITDSIFHFIWQ